jgi:peptidoglycan DL-endopeptidase CwlO
VGRRSATRRIESDQLAPGDLVFYGFSRIHHVALYVGGGRIVHAPHAGDNVREDSIDYWDDLRGYGRV